MCSRHQIQLIPIPACVGDVLGTLPKATKSLGVNKLAGVGLRPRGLIADGVEAHLNVNGLGVGGDGADVATPSLRQHRAAEELSK